MLSAADVEFYRENGYVVAPDVLDGATLSRIRQVVAEICEGARGLETHDKVFDLEPSHRPDAPRVRRIKVPHSNFPFFRELAGYGPMVAILQQLLGPDVRLHGSKINMKAPATARPWNGIRTGPSIPIPTTTCWPWACCSTMPTGTTGR